MSHTQPNFCDFMNRPQGTPAFESIVPSSSLSSPSSSSSSSSNADSASDIFKRRLSEVAWSHSMEVSEEKRYKMGNRYK